MRWLGGICAGTLRTRKARCRPSARPRPIAGRRLSSTYNQCIAHGIDMRLGMKRRDPRPPPAATRPLFRFDPEMRDECTKTLSASTARARTFPLKSYAYNELRHSSPHLYQAGRRGGGCWPTRRRRCRRKYLQYEEACRLRWHKVPPGCRAPRGERAVRLSLARPEPVTQKPVGGICLTAEPRNRQPPAGLEDAGAGALLCCRRCSRSRSRPRRSCMAA